MDRFTKTYKSSWGVFISFLSIPLFITGGILLYHDIAYFPYFSLLLGIILISSGLYIIFRSYGNNIIFPEKVEKKISEAYRKSFAFYEPDNHNLTKAKKYGKILFEQYTENYLYIYSGKLSINFYEEMYNSIKLSHEKKNADIKIILEEDPEDDGLLKKFIGAKIEIVKYNKEKGSIIPHFFVTDTAYRIELDQIPYNKATKGHGISDKTRGFFVFNADKEKINKLKTIFENMYSKSDKLL